MGEPGIDGKIALRWNFRECDGLWTRLSWLGIAKVGGHL
jgi:hypothetical protein